MGLRTVGVRLVAELGQFKQGMGEAARGVRTLTGELDKAARAGQLDAVTGQATRMGMAMVAGFGAATFTAAKFEQQMSAVNAVANASAQELDHLRDAAIRAGEETAFSATEAARAEEELAKAGINAADVLGGALTGSLALAAAGGVEVAEAADIAAKAMNVFQLSGADVGHIADVLANAANKSATDVHELGMAIKMSGLAAAAAGMGIEETVGTLAAFADRALVGSDAGTSLKTALMMLAAPTDKAAALMEKLGIHAYDANGNFVGTVKLAGQLRETMGDLTQEQRNAAMATIFGADAMRASNALFELGEQGVRDYVNAVDQQGSAARTAATRMDNLMGDVEKLTGSLESLAIESSGGALSGLRGMTQAADRFVGSLAVVPEGVSNAAFALVGVTGVMLLAGAATAKMREGAANLSEALSNTGPAGQKAAKGLQAVASGVSKAVVAMAALQAVSAVFGSSVNAEVVAYGDALADWAKDGQVAGEAARILGKDMELLSFDLGTLDSGFWTDFGNGIAGVVEGTTGLGNVMDESLTKARERLSALDSALTSMVQNGRGKEAEQIFNKIATAAQAQGVSIDELKAGLPGYSAALDGIARAADPVAQAQKRAATTAEALATGWSDAAAEGNGLHNTFMKLNGAALGWSEANLDMQDAIREASKAVADNGRAWAANTEAGSDNQRALLRVVEATATATQSMYDNTQSAEKAKQVWDQGRAALIALAIQTGMTRQQAEDLANEWMAMPQFSTTTVTTPGLSEAIERAQRLRNLLGSYVAAAGADNTNPYVTGYVTPGRRWGGITEHARDGLLRQAQVYSSVSSGARYAFAEPATMGEAFVPRNGNYGRSMSILSQAAGWYGASVMPRRPEWAPAPAAAAAGGRTVIVQLIDPMSGKVLRQTSINEATSRGVAPAKIREAYP